MRLFFYSFLFLNLLPTIPFTCTAFDTATVFVVHADVHDVAADPRGSVRDKTNNECREGNGEGCAVDLKGATSWSAEEHRVRNSDEECVSGTDDAGCVPPLLQLEVEAGDPIGQQKATEDVTAKETDDADANKGGGGGEKRTKVQNAAGAVVSPIEAVDNATAKSGGVQAGNVAKLGGLFGSMKRFAMLFIFAAAAVLGVVAYLESHTARSKAVASSDGTESCDWLNAWIATYHLGAMNWPAAADAFKTALVHALRAAEDTEVGVGQALEHADIDGVALEAPLMPQLFRITAASDCSPGSKVSGPLTLEFDVEYRALQAINEVTLAIASTQRALSVAITGLTGRAILTYHPNAEGGPSVSLHFKKVKALFLRVENSDEKKKANTGVACAELKSLMKKVLTAAPGLEWKLKSSNHPGGATSRKRQAPSFAGTARGVRATVGSHLLSRPEKRQTNPIPMRAAGGATEAGAPPQHQEQLPGQNNETPAPPMARIRAAQPFAGAAAAGAFDLASDRPPPHPTAPGDARPPERPAHQRTITFPADGEASYERTAESLRGAYTSAPAATDTFGSLGETPARLSSTALAQLNAEQAASAFSPSMVTATPQLYVGGGGSGRVLALDDEQYDSAPSPLRRAGTAHNQPWRNSFSSDDDGSVTSDNQDSVVSYGTEASSVLSSTSFQGGTLGQDGRAVSRSKSKKKRKEKVFTERLLENTDGCTPTPPHQCSLGGSSLLPSVYADVRYIDDVIAIEA